MRSLLLALAVSLGLAACGGATAPQRASAAFKVDGATCASLGTVTLDFFIDGTSVGTESLAPGVQSKSYAVAPGSHVTLVEIANSSFGWANATMNYPAGQTTVRILPCS